MSIGIWQIVLILVIVLILFGAGKLPRVMGDVAKGVKSFKAGLKEGDEPEGEPAAAGAAAAGETPRVGGAEAAKAETKADEAAKT